MRTGSPRTASFKGNNEAEYAWFSISDALPVISMSEKRAARRIVNACLRGEAELVLSLPAKAAVRLHGLFPGTTTDGLGLMNVLLPPPGGIGRGVRTGKQSTSTASPSWDSLSKLTPIRRNPRMRCTGAAMNKQASAAAFVVFLISMSPAVLLAAADQPAGGDLWPTKGWDTASPANVGLKEQNLSALDKDLAGGKFLLMDSFVVIRCGKKVYERTYAHDYVKIYGKQAKEKGALNQRQTGLYNYFDPYWHPYYHGTHMHSMQSVTKTVTSVIIGVARTRGDFKAGLDTPVLKYFDVSKVRNVDERKRRMTLHDLITMTSGLDWDEDVPDNDPRNDMSRMEGTDDWVQYTIDRPMAAEPGKAGNYNSGATELLAYIFQKETGQDIDEYGEKYLFAPLGIKHYWKRTYLGVVDTEGGLFLSASDLAKIGYLYLRDGMWERTRIVSKEWIKESLKSSFDVDSDFDYGFLWWLLKRADSSGYVWIARGFGAQHLMVFPKENLIAVFTGWRILGKEADDYEADEKEFARRILTTVKSESCGDSVRSNPR